MLSSSFSYDQIHKRQRCDFGHTLLCYLSRTWMFSKPNTGLLPLKIRLEYHRLTISNTLAYCVMVLNLAVKKYLL
jgi:hypothetical protein